MNWPYELQIGWRYTRAGRATRRNGFISFISGVSMLGIALGVAALIIVLSVMNGFQKEVRDRMLSVISHVDVFAPQGQAVDDWERIAREARRHPQVAGAAPYVAAQALLARGDDMKGAMIRGISPQHEPEVTPLAAELKDGPLQRLVPGEWGILLGSELARSLGVAEGDKVTVVSPSGQMTPAGVVPRLKQMTVVGTFHAGHYEYDSALALMHLDDAAKLFRVGGPTGVQLRLHDVHQARTVAADLARMLSGDLYISDWTRTNANWYAAVQLEKRMMFIILTLIVAVAAFNLVSMLVMTVTDKRADIAILRTLGASPASVMVIFMVQGALAGLIGTLGGLVLGLAVAFNIDVIVPALERLFDTAFLPGSIYLISRMPSDPQAGDIVPIALISLLLAFLATLYPSWRASRVKPAEALRYE
ncbi:lipoprotein-releasing ABC transporter permease subunit [Caldimonas thermodepolymerans]|jgi:lipoprotein releasing system, transmembrane protein, LolC/E family|uniref:Lipoprotein-releasing system permease protein n=1 Tax=Caldimonas thermodepolymerans TaxID=215580 RepID=A0A2S5T4D4_9BURK|nr:lipoprotein-releasing ABC transporter permease subunit [Caldimonas thermodepolymerans]PPE69854.1 lipoprotein-releasing system transmembrane subunit LolC [Caldimonas thermodepolymerans]QPC32689.1 lipoprotein-releasing ABC transporter permease subunit [Caldimonas thermodepolymerans]RDI03446.1 lipoprotein-releasing system permease protein [Caldimonas thermodepolymerans]TCP06695.1 lipoprotein-releasing system permease protein [Caldimonas thermodepolymerans]UZG49252.1 lipoprotein-releasing ABC t